MTVEKIFVKPGDWIRLTPLSPGIWKVYRVLTNFQENRWSQDDPPSRSSRTLVFCYRLVNDSWKRSFSNQVCELSFARVLPPDDIQKLENVLRDSKLMNEFAKYQATAKAIDLVANIPLGGLSDEAKEGFPKLCAELLAGRIENGITLDEVLALLRSQGLDTHMNVYPLQVTLQLASAGHELRGDEFLYRRWSTRNG